MGRSSRGHLSAVSRALHNGVELSSPGHRVLEQARRRKCLQQITYGDPAQRSAGDSARSSADGKIPNHPCNRAGSTVHLRRCAHCREQAYHSADYSQRCSGVLRHYVNEFLRIRQCGLDCAPDALHRSAQQRHEGRYELFQIREVVVDIRVDVQLEFGKFLVRREESIACILHHGSSGVRLHDVDAFRRTGVDGKLALHTVSISRRVVDHPECFFVNIPVICDLCRSLGRPRSEQRVQRRKLSFLGQLPDGCKHLFQCPSAVLLRRLRYALCRKAQLIPCTFHGVRCALAFRQVDVGSFDARSNGCRVDTGCQHCIRKGYRCRRVNTGKLTNRCRSIDRSGQFRRGRCAVCCHIVDLVHQTHNVIMAVVDRFARCVFLAERNLPLCHVVTGGLVI